MVSSKHWERMKRAPVSYKSPKGVGGCGNRKKKTQEIMDENFLNLTKSINTEIQETQQTPSTTNMKKTTGRYIII